MKKKHLNIGKPVLMGTAAFTGVGGFIFDWNKTHLFNPNWPPHAKFHDGMTILLGSMLGFGGLYLLQKKGSNARLYHRWGTLLPAFFWAAQAGSFALPGAKGLEAEFPEKVSQVGSVRLNEGVMSGLMLVILGIGYFIHKNSAPE